MQTAWEEALNHWPKWKKSVDKARADIAVRYGNVEALLDKAGQEFEAGRDAFGGDPIGAWVAKHGKRFEIMDVLEKPARSFVEKEMHLPRLGMVYDLHWAFVDIWMNSACPALKSDAKEASAVYKEYPQGPLELDTHVRQVGVLSGKTEGRIWHLVRWYSDEATPLEVAAFIQKRPELFCDDRIRPHPGGRPREEFRIDIESVICYVLRKIRVPNMKERGVAKLFGYSEKEFTDYGKPASRLVRTRVKRGKEIIELYNRLAKDGK
jgi:hypothetical protein